MTRRSYPAVEAVGELIRIRTEWWDADDGTRRRVHVPCLLALLIVHLHSSSGGTGGGHTAGSVPINTQAWDLLREIEYDAHSWADLLQVDPKPYLVEDTPRAGKPTTPPIGKLLRAVAVAASTTAREPVAEAITRYARRWAQQITEIDDKQREQRGIRGAPCPTCGADRVTEQRDDANRTRDDGQGTFHTPALVLIAARLDEPEPTLCCLACGWHAPIGAAAVQLAGTTATVAYTTQTRRDDHSVDADQHEAA